jgi:hypothetical protein
VAAGAHDPAAQPSCGPSSPSSSQTHLTATPPPLCPAPAARPLRPYPPPTDRTRLSAAPHRLTTLPHRCQTAAAPRAPYSLVAAPLPRQPETLNLMSPPPPPLIHHPVRRWRTRHHLVPPPPPPVSATTSRCCRALPPLSPVTPPPLPLGRPTAGPGWAGASWVTRLRGGATADSFSIPKQVWNYLRHPAGWILGRN